MNDRRLSPLQLVGFAMGLFAVQSFWGFTWATLPLYLKGFAESNTVTGIMLSTAGVTGLVMPILSGAVSDRINTQWGRRRPLIAAGWLLTCSMLLIMPLLGSLPAALPAMIIAYAGFFMAIGPYFSLLPDMVPASQRGAASGVMFLVGGTGMLSYLFFAARLWDQSHLRPFLWTVGAIILSSAVMCISVKERPGPGIPVKRSGLINEALRNRETARFFAGMILWWVGLWMVSAFFVIACRDLFSVSTERAVQAFIIFNAAFVLFALPSGLMATRLGFKRVLIAALVTLAGGLLCIPLLRDFTASIPFLVITGAAYGAVIAVSYPFFLRLIPAEKTAGFVGIYMACQNGTLLLGPAVGGIILDRFGYTALFFSAAAFIIAGMTLLLTVRSGESRTVTVN